MDFDKPKRCLIFYLNSIKPWVSLQAAWKCKYRGVKGKTLALHSVEPHLEYSNSLFLLWVQSVSSTQLHNRPRLNMPGKHLFQNCMVSCWFLKVLLSPPPPLLLASQMTAVMSYSVSEMMATGAEQQVGIYLCLLHSAHAQQLSTGDEGLV